MATELDFRRLEQVRESIPSLANRVSSAYAWPEERGRNGDPVSARHDTRDVESVR